MVINTRGEVPGFRERKAHCRVGIDAQKPFAPVSPPVLQAVSTHLLCVFGVFSPLRTLGRALSTSEPTTHASTRVSAANRRQNHKNFALWAKAGIESNHRGERTKKDIPER